MFPFVLAGFFVGIVLVVFVYRRWAVAADEGDRGVSAVHAPVA